MANKFAEQSVEAGDFRRVFDLLQSTTTDPANLVPGHGRNWSAEKPRWLLKSAVWNSSNPN